MSIGVLHLLFAAIAVILVVIAVAKFRLHPFLALTVGAILLGLASSLSINDTVAAYTAGFGGTLGKVAPVIGLGVLLGAVLTATGGANVIADAFVGKRKKVWIPFSIAVAGLLIGLPNVFDVTFVMLVPLAYVIARRVKSHLLFVGMPLAAGIYTAHALLPPHPSPTAAVGIYDASFGLTLAFGLIIAVPMLLITGPLFTKLMKKKFGPEIDLNGGPAGMSTEATGKRPPLWLSLGVVLLPSILLVIGAFGVNAVPDGTVMHAIFEFCDNAVVALMLSVIIAICALIPASGMDYSELRAISGKSLKTVGPVILIIGAGGGLASMLAKTGASDTIVGFAHDWSVPALVFAWLLAAILRIALGSATLSTVTAAGIVAPLALADPSISPELLVLATSSGAVMLSHVNDSGFWLFKEYFQLSVKKTFQTWTLMLSIQSVIGLAGVLVLSLFVS